MSVCVCVRMAKGGEGILGPISPDMSNRRAEKWSGVRTSREQSAGLRVTFKSFELWCNMWLSDARPPPSTSTPHQILPTTPTYFFF